MSYNGHGGHGGPGNERSYSDVTSGGSTNVHVSIESSSHASDHFNHKNHMNKVGSEVLEVVFHLYIHHSSETVTLEFDRPLKYHSNLTVRMERVPSFKSENYWKSWTVRIHPDEIESVKYKYIVKYSHGYVRRMVNYLSSQDSMAKETRYRKLFGGKNQYDIFKDPKNQHYEQIQYIFDGQFFFIRMMYDQVLPYGGNLKELMIESEHVGFGHQSFMPKDIRAFLVWLTKSAKHSTLTPLRSSFLCTLLSRFYRKTGESFTFYSDIPESRETVNSLLTKLKDCNKDRLTKEALDSIKKIDLLLLRESSFLNDLGYIYIFCDLFDCDTVLREAGRLNVISSKDFDESVVKVVERILQLKSAEDREKLLKFVIVCSPNIPSLWKIASFLQDRRTPITNHYDEIVKRYAHFFSQDNYRVPDVFDNSVWHEAPRALREKLAVPFCVALGAQLGKRTRQVDCTSLRDLLLDEYLQKYGNAELMKIVKFLASSKHVDVVCQVLDAQNFFYFWKGSSLEDKVHVVSTLASSKVKSNIYSLALKKNEVIQAFKILEEVCQLRCLKEHEDLLAKCICQEKQRCGLKAIVDAYDGIKQSVGEVGVKWYLKLLTNTVQVEQAKPDVRSKLLDMLFPTANDFQALEIDGGREEILLILLGQTKTPTSGSSSGSHGRIGTVFTVVRAETNLWKIVFQVKGQVDRLHKHPTFLSVKGVIDHLSESINNGDISLSFVKSEEDKMDIAQLLALGRCCPLGSEPTEYGTNVLKSKWIHLLDSLTSEKAELQRRFTCLKNAITVAKDVAAESGIVLKDLNDILKNFHNRKNQLNNRRFIDIRKVDYWGLMQSLLKVSEEMSELVKCTLFKNFARTKLKEHVINGSNVSQNQVSSGESEEMNEHVDKTVLEVFELLSCVVVTTFKDVLKQISEQPEKVKSKDLEEVLRGIEAKNVENELKTAFQIVNLPLPSVQVVKMVQNYVQFEDVKRKVKASMDCLDAVGYSIQPENFDDFLNTLQSFLCSKECGTLKTISTQMDMNIITSLNMKLCPGLVDTLIELSNAKELIEFIITTAKDNMVDLVEAVEEHSDQLIQETTVSYLIDVHRFLRELLSNKPGKPEMFLKSLIKAYTTNVVNRSRNTGEGNMSASQETSMAAKIKVVSCNVHSLRGLHMMLSNRGEMTKEIIKSAVSDGQYQVRIELDGSIKVQLKYARHDQNKSEAKYSFDELNDLRSRALLMVNADKSHLKTVDVHQSVISQSELMLFVEQVDLLSEIVRSYKFLKFSGMPKYEKQFWKHLNTMDEIKKEENRVTDEVKAWEEMICRMRQQHFFLNFFHTKHFWLLKSFFHKSKPDTRVSEEVLALFRCIDSGISTEDLKQFHTLYKKPKTAETVDEVNSIGSALESIFRDSHVIGSVESSSSTNDAVVEPSRLYVSVLESGSVHTVSVIMALYKNTSACLPRPSQLLFCNQRTTWEEIELLLLRTFKAHYHGYTSKLHCIANVESLPNDLQFKLVDSLKKFTSETDAPYRLAIICRGGPHHHIADQFSDYVHYHGGIPDADMRKMLKEAFPHTFLVTGDLPGLGKSETIACHAFEKDKAVVTFPISGPFVRSDLVKRLSGLVLKRFQSIHFDIGEVDDPSGLDTFLFELIVTKMVSSEALIFCLPTDHVYIEVANTLHQAMRNSLPVCKCFKRLEVTWKEYSNICSSDELTSPVQVVSQYLQAYDCGSLESQEVILSGPSKVKPLDPSKCQALLKKYFFPSDDLSFNILENFLSVLADQLLKFSRSPYFRPKHLKDMIGQNHDIRIRIFKALLEVSTSFAARSVNTCKATQAYAMNDAQAREALKKMKLEETATADEMVNRVKGMIQWTDNQQLVIMLHGAGSITAIYRDLKDVPKTVKDLFKSQDIFSKGLEDYTKMTQEELQVRLERFSDAPRNLDKTKLESSGYALTPDNILKMALIIQRMQAGIPVIIMGETGCGKTSLVRYLADTCGVPFYVFSFHAGITEKKIIDFISLKDEEARNCQKEGKSVWVFLDEINTCDYLGTINEIVCHRSLLGRPLAPNLMFVAACNPYRLRPQGCIMTAGLTGKTTFDEFSKLVYRVHPLPETMIDYVWDYGSLSHLDERTYIGRMVETLFGGTYQHLLVDLLSESQTFIRKEDKSSFCVSLRDVHRSTILMEWFYNTKKQPEYTVDSHSHLHKYFEKAKDFDSTEKAIVLALAHCYLSRLPTKDLRNRYCELMTDLLKKHGRHRFSQKDSFQCIIRVEQEDYLSRMELPDGTAKNAALRENIFVILVCILNRIPVFVVGKPGCSKSLSMQIIRSNLRGRDSKDPFLKTLPQLLVVSFQGSESSTSEGIEKVFEKARKYKSKSANVLPVVLLDEIGLAEVSKFNPLKVLHRLLEPGEGEFPDVAVVGISNWALDAAKMNRAIHLSRPEPDEDDLYDTGLSIRSAQAAHNTRSFSSDPQIRCLAEAYHEYQCNQKHENFHGLRDYYSMVKCLDNSSRLPDEHSKSIQRAMQRNFGGIATGKGELQSSFLKKLESTQPIGDVVEFHVTDLICDNLNDKMARHLMIITSGDSAVGILDQTLEDLNKEKITIFGSRFEEDLSADYSHRILSRIILCMESNCVLILRDLENIYGSLYDMLNQNYMVVGGKKNCRVALGAFSNPMCQVDDGFRCIVLVDEGKVDYSDPPFLNRFEKQLLRFADVLDNRQRKIIKKLTEWTESVSTVKDHEWKFNELDMFAGFHEDTLPSIVLFYCQDQEVPDEEVLRNCKDDLMSIAMPDAVIRSCNSQLNQSDDEEVNELYNSYFEKPIHNGLKAYLESRNCKEGMKLLVMTHSSIHTDVSKCIEGLFHAQIEKLSFFKSEKELNKRIKHFWCESQANLLVVQCRPETDARHMLLVKTIIEEQRRLFMVSRQSNGNLKHVCIVMHLRRTVEEESHYHWQFNFLSGWSQVMVDCLETPVIQIKEMLEYSVIDVIENSETVHFNKVAADQFLWCFTRIKFPLSKPANLEVTSKLVDVILSQPEIMKCLMQLCCRWLECEQNTSNPKWQITVACDRQALINSSTLVKAMENFIIHLVRLPLARIVYFLQRNSAFKALTSEDYEIRQEVLKLLTNENIFNISEVPEPQGPESLVLDSSHPDLQFPFSYLFYKRVDAFYDFFSSEYRRQCLEECNLDENGELSSSATTILVQRVAMRIEQVIVEITDSDILPEQLSIYIDDFLDINTDDVSDVLTRDQRVVVMKAHYGDRMPAQSGSDRSDIANTISKLHCNFWLEGNTTPQVFYFLKDCMSIYIPHFDFDDLVSCYYAQKEKMEENDDYVDDLSSEPCKCSEDDNRALKTDESEEEARLPEEHSEKEAIQNEESFQIQVDDNQSDVQEEQEPSLSEVLGNQLSKHSECMSFEDIADHQQDCHVDAQNEENISKEQEQQHLSTKCVEDQSTASEDVVDEQEQEQEQQHSSTKCECVEGQSTASEDVVDEELQQIEDRDDIQNDDEHSLVSEEERNKFENAADTEPTFEDFVVEIVCYYLLPTDDCVKLIGGVSKWKNASSLVLSSVTKYCDPLAVFYYLKVCNDFADLISANAKKEHFSLYAFGELGKQVDDNSYLDSPKIFQAVCDSIKNLQNDDHDEKRIDEFLFLFYERCLQSNPDSERLGEILSKVACSQQDDMLYLASSILHQILLSETDAFALHNLENLMTSTGLENFPNLMEINVVLSEMQKPGMELDCHINVICCDLVNRIAIKDLKIKEEMSSDDQAVRNFRTAVDVLTESELSCKIFGFICAVSYLRAFMTELASLASANKVKHLDLLHNICMLLEVDSQIQNRTSSASIFLLKELSQSMCLYDVKQLIENSKGLQQFKPLLCKAEETSCKLDYDPFKIPASKADAATALGSYVESKNSEAFKKYLACVKNSCEKRMEFASVIIEQFYVPRSVRPLKDTEDDVAKFVTECMTEVSAPYKKFIACIASRECFKCEELEVSPESRAIDVEVAVLILHLCAVLTSNFKGQSKNPIMSCLFDPASLKESYIVSSPDDHSGYPVYKHHKSNKPDNAHLFSCKCGYRVASQQLADMKCSLCKSPVKEDGMGAHKSWQSERGYVKSTLESMKYDMLHVRNLDPIEFRILHFIVHAALLAGYSLDMSTNILNDVIREEKPSDFCYKVVRTDVDVLSRLLCLKKEKVVSLIHHAIEETSSNLTDDTLPIPHGEKERSAWEANFAKNVQVVIERFRKDGGTSLTENEDRFKTVIEEHPITQLTDNESRNMSIPRLFRVIQPNTFNKLRDVYLNSSQDVKDKHQLLGLFLDYHDTLSRIGSLASLISWNRRVEGLLNRAITRKDAKEKKIYDAVMTKEKEYHFVYQSKPNESSSGKAFEEFQRAWRKVAPLVNEIIQGNEPMPLISEMSPVGYCLAEKKDLGRYLWQSLILLSEMQNAFLDKCLAIASSGKCAALQFLSKEGSQAFIPIVHVQDAKEREIISYEWTDDFLGHSHTSTEYGQGKNITYDMGKIEKDLAGCFLLGKAYLDTKSGLREFVFSKQLFHDCANILNVLCEAIPQDKLPRSVEAELDSSAKKSMDRMQNLLEHLEVLLCYLKSMNMTPDKSLAEFIATFMHSSRPFPKDLLPTTLNAIQIKHVCALYEFVEDQLAIPSVECTEDEYRRDILVETQAKLEETCKDVGKANIEAVITAIKRFVFRYLHMKPHPDECLLEFMKDPSLWPMALRVQRDDNAFKVSEAAPKFFPKELTVGQIYEIHTYYNNLLKKLTAKITYSTSTSQDQVQRVTRPSNRRVTKKRKLKGGGFS